MLEKRTVYTQEVLEDSQIQVRRDDQIWEDGVFIAHNYHRHVVSPGQNTDSEDDQTKAIALAVHTPEIIAAYQTREAERIAASGI